MPARARGYSESVFSGDIYSAHRAEQPLANRTLWIVVERCYTALCRSALPRLPDGVCAVFGHKQPAGHFFIFKQFIGIINIDVCKYIQNKRSWQKACAKSPTVIIKCLDKSFLCKFRTVFVKQIHKQRSYQLCLSVCVKRIIFFCYQLSVSLFATVRIFLEQR